MALSQTVAWEVRTTGLDTNSGGFNTASAGTDYSQQNTPHVTFNGTTITATSTGTVLTITGYVVNAGDVGNILKITGGVGFTPGNYQINAVTIATNRWTVDRTTGVGTAMTGAMGGGLLTISNAFTQYAPNDAIIYIQNGTYNITTGLTTATETGGKDQNRIFGYITNHSTAATGNNRPVIATASNAINALSAVGSGGWIFSNLILTNVANGVSGINLTSNNNTSIFNCKVSGFATGIIGSTSHSIVNTEVTGSTTAGITATNIVIIGCWVHDMTCVGISVITNDITIGNCLISNCSGATSDGILDAASGITVFGTTIYKSGRDGIRLSGNVSLAPAVMYNNIFANNTGFGIDIVVAQDSPVSNTVNYNGFYSNTAGDRNNLSVSPNDVPMTQSPFTAPGSNDFSLNNVLNGGASLRNAGFPGVLPGLPTPAGFDDIGVYRHQDVTSVTENLYVLAYD